MRPSLRAAPCACPATQAGDDLDRQALAHAGRHSAAQSLVATCLVLRCPRRVGASTASRRPVGVRGAFSSTELIRTQITCICSAIKSPLHRLLADWSSRRACIEQSRQRRLRSDLISLDTGLRSVSNVSTPRQLTPDPFRQLHQSKTGEIVGLRMGTRRDGGKNGLTSMPRNWLA